jgi:sugar-specific transcriptional regulator TrmB
MEPLVIGLIVVAAAVLGWIIWQQQRTRSLRTRYADEYDRTVTELGRRQGEAELVRREARVRELNIQPLSATERVRYLAEWRRVQEQFVDDPKGAVMRGNDLVEEVLRSRGYPITDDFDRQVADISVDHPRVVQNYRLAREIVGRYRRGSASTEDLRQGMVLYRELFEDLLEDTPADVRTERVVSRPVERDVAIQDRDEARRRYIDREARP